MKFFMVLLLSLSFFSSAETIIEDMAVYSVFEENSATEPLFPVRMLFPANTSFPASMSFLRKQESSHAQGRAGRMNALFHDTYPQQESDSMDSPYAPFPWPCDSLEDCTRFFNKADFMDSPYAPFPWPCDSLEDCTHSYPDNINFFGYIQE